MPKETDQRCLRILREAFAATASDVPEFTETAIYGGFRSDEGLVALLPDDRSPYAKRNALKTAITEFLERGGAPNRVSAPGDRRMQLEAALFHEFRLEVEGVRLYVKTVLDEDDPNDPEVSVLSVKRDDRTWV